jgi:hypothetical protein
MTSMSAQQILDREFLEIRAKILELAACFDRLERAEGCVDQDVRRQQLQQALELLSTTGSDRAERVPLVFSREYDEKWQTALQLRS